MKLNFRLPQSFASSVPRLATGSVAKPHPENPPSGRSRGLRRTPWSYVEHRRPIGSQPIAPPNLPSSALLNGLSQGHRHPDTAAAIAPSARSPHAVLCRDGATATYVHNPPVICHHRPPEAPGRRGLGTTRA